MPQRTIAPGGGNWNSTATWVEGAVPTTSDFVVGNASSGALNVNVTATVQYVDFTSYANTMTITNSLQVALAGATNTFGASMTIAGAGGLFAFGAVASTIVQNNTNRIPNVRFSGNVIRTLSTNMYITNVETTTAPTFNGNTMFINGNLFNNVSIASTDSNNIKGTTVFNLDGNGMIANCFSNTVIINSGSTYNTYGMGFVLENGCNFTYQSGTTPTLFNMYYITRVSSAGESITLNISRTGCNLFLDNRSINSSTSLNKTINLSNPINLSTLTTFNISRNYTTDNGRPIFIFVGNSLNANILSLSPSISSTSSNVNPPASGGYTYRSVDIQLDRLYTHTIGSLQLIGGGITTKPVIRSNSSGNQVSINLTSKITSQIVDYDFTDVNAVGDEIVAINGTLSNTTNVTNVYPSGSGGGETSSVFIS